MHRTSIGNWPPKLPCSDQQGLKLIMLNVTSNPWTPLYLQSMMGFMDLFGEVMTKVKPTFQVPGPTLPKRPKHFDVVQVDLGLSADLFDNPMGSLTP